MPWTVIYLGPIYQINDNTNDVLIKWRHLAIIVQMTSSLLPRKLFDWGSFANSTWERDDKMLSNFEEWFVEFSQSEKQSDEFDKGTVGLPFEDIRWPVIEISIRNALRTENHRKFGQEPKKFDNRRKNCSSENDIRPVIEWPSSKSHFEQNITPSNISIKKRNRKWWKELNF